MMSFVDMGQLDERDVKTCIEEINRAKRPFIIEVWQALITTTTQSMCSINMPRKTENPFLFTFQTVEPTSKVDNIDKSTEVMGRKKRRESASVESTDCVRLGEEGKDIKKKRRTRKEQWTKRVEAMTKSVKY